MSGKATIKNGAAPAIFGQDVADTLNDLNDRNSKCCCGEVYCDTASQRFFYVGTDFTKTSIKGGRSICRRPHVNSSGKR